jgi:glutamate/tyrosine decarboxylase-like PLP-dependent enzyme
MTYEDVLRITGRLALPYLNSLRERPVVGRESDPVVGPVAMPESGDDPETMLTELAELVDRAGVATAGPRYFGFVIGGTLPAAVAADWLVTAWDQNAALNVMSPAMATLEDRTAAWLLDVFDLPRGSSVGFVSGATTANATCLAAARDEVLRHVGWDVEAGGFQRAPLVTMVAGYEAHSSIESACRVLGFGTTHTARVEADEQGRMVPASLQTVLGGITGPTIVCLQAGHVNTGAFDPFPELIAIARRVGAWIHVDGAFGLWARAAERFRRLCQGLELADSWAVDAHKWLNVPYDSGLAIVAHQAPHRAAMAQRASYLIRAEGERRDGMDWTPEASRRARAVPIYAALRTLGRRGICDVVTRCCDLASRMAWRLRREPAVEILNEVVLNQVLVRLRDSAGANVTPKVIARVQEGGVCWVGGTSWQGEPAMRISVSNWSTTEHDVDVSAEAIIAALPRNSRN